MRTEKKFASATDNASWFVRFHNKPVWLIPLSDDYCLSIVEPKCKDLPFGTAAVLYTTDMEVVKVIKSSKNP